MESKSAFLYTKDLRGIDLVMNGRRDDSINIVSWSPIPGIICVVLTREGLFVKNRSGVVDELRVVLVGS